MQPLVLELRVNVEASRLDLAIKKAEEILALHKAKWSPTSLPTLNPIAVQVALAISTAIRPRSKISYLAED